MCNTPERKVGLACLDDETLARIVEAEVEQNGEIKSSEAFAAFSELTLRTELAK